MIILLIALSLVRERERGTLEQLSTMTPVAPSAFMVGKMIPPTGFWASENSLPHPHHHAHRLSGAHPRQCLRLARNVATLPAHRTLESVSFISTKARTQAEAFQLSMGTVLPSVFLSGYIFLIDTMPPFFRGVSRLIPATYYIQILRGVILRGAGFTGPVALHALVLSLMGCTTVLLAARQFVNQRGR